MTPEQQEFYEELGDALGMEYNIDTVDDYHAFYEECGCCVDEVLKEAAQKLHDLWPTLCELDEKREVYLKAMNKPAGLRDVPLARYFLSNATEVLGTIISKAVGGRDE